MARLRIRVKVSPGRLGAPLQKLSSITNDLHSFLKSVSDDMDIDTSGEEWIAIGFGDGSAIFTATNTGSYEIHKAELFHSEIKALVKHDPVRQRLNGKLSHTTVSKYAAIGSHLDPDEHIDLGFFESDKDSEPQEWGKVSRNITEGLVAKLVSERQYLGAVFGKIHALYKEVDGPHFTLREVDKGDLVRCYFKDKDYDEVICLLTNKNAYIHVGGMVFANLITGKIESIQAEKYSVAKGIADEDIKSLKGSIPDLTGDLSTEEFLKRFRQDD